MAQSISKRPLRAAAICLAAATAFAGLTESAGAAVTTDRTAASTPAATIFLPRGAGSETAHRDRKIAQRRGLRRGFRRGRGRGFRGRRRGRGVGPGIAAGIAGLIIGSAIVNGARARGRRDAWDECDQRYKTFRYSDGTYIPHVGSDRVLCPLLR